MILEGTYLKIIGKNRKLQSIYGKLKKAKKVSEEEIRYLDDVIRRTAKKEKRRSLCNFMFDLLNEIGMLRRIFDSCDTELHLFRFSRITNLEEDMRFVEQGMSTQVLPEEDEELECRFVDEDEEESEEVIKIKRSELERFDREVRIDDWVEGELDLCFWAIGKYIGLDLQSSFLEFLELYLRRERFHFLLQWYYREVVKKIEGSKSRGRELWLYTYTASRFKRDHLGYYRCMRY